MSKIMIELFYIIEDKVNSFIGEFCKLNIAPSILHDIERHKNNIAVINLICENYYSYFTEEFIINNIDLMIFSDLHNYVLTKCSNVISEKSLHVIIENIKTHNNYFNYKLPINKKININETFLIIFRHINVSCEFLEKYIDYIHWNLISQYQKLSEEFMMKYKYKISFTGICSHQKISVNFIELYKREIEWNFLSQNKNLTKEVFEKYIDKLIIYSSYLDIKFLTKDVISNYINHIDWEYISLTKPLTKEFIIDNIQYLNVENIINNKEIDADTKNWFLSIADIL